MATKLKRIKKKKDTIPTLKDCLFTLIRSLNTSIDRLCIVTDRFEELVIKNEELLRQSRQEVLQRIIEEAVELELEKNRRRR